MGFHYDKEMIFKEYVRCDQCKKEDLLFQTTKIVTFQELLIEALKLGYNYEHINEEKYKLICKNCSK